MIERVSTFGLSSLMLRSATTIQSRLAEKQTASASGLVTDTYANLSGQAARMISLETAMAERLELEITESFLLRNAEQAMTLVERLSELGIRVAIDDFGTGYSSLSYLKFLRVDKLKLDQRFVRDLPDDRDDAAITRAVIALGHNLGFKVIAEGVESEAQRDFLRREGCDQSQGYFHARPLPAAEFERLLACRATAA